MYTLSLHSRTLDLLKSNSNPTLTLFITFTYLDWHRIFFYAIYTSLFLLLLLPLSMGNISFPILKINLHLISNTFSFQKLHYQYRFNTFEITNTWCVNKSNTIFKWIFTSIMPSVTKLKPICPTHYPHISYRLSFTNPKQPNIEKLAPKVP